MILRMGRIGVRAMCDRRLLTLDEAAVKEGARTDWVAFSAQSSRTVIRY